MCGKVVIVFNKLGVSEHSFVLRKMLRFDNDVYSPGHATLLWRKFWVNFVKDSTALSWHVSSGVWSAPLKAFVGLVLWVRE